MRNLPTSRRRYASGTSRIAPGGRLAVFRGGLGPGGWARQGPIAAHRQVPKDAIGDRFCEPIGTGGRVMSPVGSEHRLRASLLNHPVQIIDRNAELAHDRGGLVVVPPHVGLGPVEVRTLFACRSSRMGVVFAKTSRGIRACADAGDDLTEVLGVLFELDLMVSVSLGPFQVVQTAVQMHDVGLLPEHPLVEVGEHVRAVAAVFRRADDDGLAGKPLGDPGRSPGESNRRRVPLSGARARGVRPPGPMLLCSP